MIKAILEIEGLAPLNVTYSNLDHLSGQMLIEIEGDKIPSLLFQSENLSIKIKTPTNSLLFSGEVSRLSTEVEWTTINQFKANVVFIPTKNVKPDNLVMTDKAQHTYNAYVSIGWTDQQLVNEGYAKWVFKVGDWVWTTHTGWTQLLDNSTDNDFYPIRIQEGDCGQGEYNETYTLNGKCYEEDEHASLFHFDPLKGTPKPITKEEPTIKEEEPQYVPIRQRMKDDYEALFQSIADSFGMSREELGTMSNAVMSIKNGNGESFAEEHVEPDISNNIEFEGILDNIDFNELVDKFKDDYSLRGGQVSDGTWFLNGTRK